MFSNNSRYHHLQDRVHTSSTGATVMYKSRRLLALERPLNSPFDIETRAGERPDLLAHRILGDPQLYWRLCDANGVVEPNELTAVAGRRIKSPMPG